MSRGKWNREQITDAPVKRLPEGVLDDNGQFDTSNYPDCDLFDINSIARAAGFTRANNFKYVALSDVSSHFHLHQVKNEDGDVIVHCTHVNSAQAGGENYRQAAKERMLAGKKRISDVSGGSGAN